LAIPMGGNDKSSLSTLLFIHFLLIFDLHLADDVLQGNINEKEKNKRMRSRVYVNL
jgi:hypothetical protein